MKPFSFCSEMVELSRIDINFTPFSFSYGFELDQITGSIQKVGLINRPIIKREQDRFIIVTGFKRILALKRLGWDKVEGHVIKQDIPSLECLLISLYDNITTRNFNHVEKAIILSRLSEYLPLEQIIQEYMPLLGLSKHRPILDMYLWIDRGVGDDLKMLIVREKLSIKALRLLFEWNIREEDLKIYAYILNNLKLSFNQQIQFIEYSYDICREKHIGLRQFLEASGINDVIENASLSSHDKIKRVMDILRQKRFPKLYNAERKFYEKVKKIGLPMGVSISAPLYFEAPHYKMLISFRDGKELRSKIAKLTGIKELEEIRDPWQEQ